MPKRGRVLRDPHLGPGLLIVEGKQYPFLMEGLWRSDVPAKPGLVVNVDFDSHGNLNAITAVPQYQLDQEEEEHTRVGLGSRVFAPPVPGTLARMAVTGLLMACWLFLPAVSIHLPVLGNFDLTFWQALGYLNAGRLPQISDTSPDSGIFGFAAILVLLGPFFHHLWKNRPATLGGALPLLFMIFVGYRMGATFHSALAAPFAGSELLQTSLPYKALSLGLGTYLSASFAIYFAASSVKQALAVTGSRGREIGRSQTMAA
jgi:hypothetical protein